MYDSDETNITSAPDIEETPVVVKKLEFELVPIIGSIFQLVRNIAGTYLTPEHLYDLVRLHEATEDAAEPKTDQLAKELARETAEDIRNNDTIRQLQEFFEEVTPMFKTMFRLIFQAAPDTQLMQLQYMLEQNPSNIHYQDKAATTIANNYLAAFFANYLAANTNIMLIGPCDEPDEVIESMSTYMSELALHLIRTPNEVPETSI